MHMVSCAVCFCVYLCWFKTAIVNGALVGIHTACSYAPVYVGLSAGMGGGLMVVCIHAFVCCCLLPVLFSVLLSRGHSPVQEL